MTTSTPDAKLAVRRRRLLIAAAATLGATAWAALQGDDASGDATRPPAGAERRVARAILHARAPDSGSATPTPEAAWPSPPRADGRPAWPEPPPTAVAAWGPPPPPPAPPPAAPAPVAPPPVQAPPFPYTVIGRLDDGTPHVLLSGRQRSFGAKAHDVIDGAWRIDAIQAEGVTLTWLPADIHRTVVFPSS